MSAIRIYYHNGTFSDHFVNLPNTNQKAELIGYVKDHIALMVSNANRTLADFIQPPVNGVISAFGVAKIRYDYSITGLEEAIEIDQEEIASWLPNMK